MPRLITGPGGRYALALAASLALSLGAPAAQEQKKQEAQQPLVPVVASTLMRRADAYEGKHVSLMGVVAARVSESAFFMNQGRPTAAGQDLLILVPPLNGPVELKTTVTVVGQVVRFDPAALARTSRTASADLPPEVVAAYRGRLVVLATAVVNQATVDLTKRAPARSENEATASGPARGLKCTFSVMAAGTWVSGQPKVEVKAATLAVAFDSINTDEGTARTVGQFGAADITVHLAEGSRHFMQVFKSGAMYATTVFDKESRPGKVRAVHTRHEAGGSSEYYGECDTPPTP